MDIAKGSAFSSEATPWYFGKSIEFLSVIDSVSYQRFAIVQPASRPGLIKNLLWITWTGGVCPSLSSAFVR